MCPSGLALHHEAADTLLKYATSGYQTETRKLWTVEQMEVAVLREPHTSAMDKESIWILAKDVAQKEKQGQCRVINWEDIKHNPPDQLKASPTAIIPHKSQIV